MTPEKIIPVTDTPLTRPRALNSKWRLSLGFSLIFCLFIVNIQPPALLSSVLFKEDPSTEEPSGCPQHASLTPLQNPNLDVTKSYLWSQEWREKTVSHHSGAVQIRTESFDGEGPVGVDKRWDVFYDFASYLNSTFPLL
jgi:Gly-Xaa carboxypeptidase